MQKVCHGEYRVNKRKKPLIFSGFAANAIILRGLEQIRTAVEAFAELCLATRPRDQLFQSQNSRVCRRSPRRQNPDPSCPTPGQNQPSTPPIHKSPDFFGWLQN